MERRTFLQLLIGSAASAAIGSAPFLVSETTPITDAVRRIGLVREIHAFDLSNDGQIARFEVLVDKNGKLEQYGIDFLFTSEKELEDKRKMALNVLLNGIDLNDLMPLPAIDGYKTRFI